MDKMYILNYDHLGIIMWQAQAMETILEQELSRLKKYPNYTVGWDHEVYAYDHLCEKEPALYQKMKQAFEAYPDRLDVGSCTYGQPLATFVSGESNIRQLTLAGDAMENTSGSAPRFIFPASTASTRSSPRFSMAAGSAVRCSERIL